MSILKVANIHFNAAGTTHLRANGANTLTLETAGTERLRVDANGTVFLGGVPTYSTTSFNRLEVFTTGASSGGAIANRSESVTQIINERATTDSTGPIFIAKKTRGTLASPTAVASGDNLGALRFQGYGGTTIRNLAEVTSHVETYTSDSDISSYLAFGTTPSGSSTSTEKMRLDSYGNLGIGTASPQTKLHVISTADNGFRLEKTTDGAIYQEFYRNGSRVGYVGSADPATTRFQIWNTTNQDMLFGTNNLERARIDSSGNVLIGRTDSTVGLGVKLDVAGAINCANIFVNGSPISGGGGGGSVTIADQTTTTTTQYITFTTSTSGTASSINVASSKLTFNVASGTLSSTIFNATSDINKKTNIEPVKDAMNILQQIDGVRFDWKDNMTPSLGVIAQTVEKVLPELVDSDKSVNYNGLIAILIEAIKELKAEVDSLKAKS